MLADVVIAAGGTCFTADSFADLVDCMSTVCCRTVLHGGFAVAQDDIGSEW